MATTTRVQSAHIVGLDFGTTNSILAQFQSMDTAPVVFDLPQTRKFGIPTVAPRIDDSDASGLDLLARMIGLRSEGADINFKFGLNAWKGDKSAVAYKAARRFLKGLFHNYCKTHGLKGVDELVITVPENWISANERALEARIQQRGGAALASICKELGLPKPRIISEPVAATAYLALRHRQVHGKEFDGYVIVYDHGGGTLDISLCRVQGGKVHRLGGLGEDTAQHRAGFGGVMFDKRVMERVALTPRGKSLKNATAKAKADWLHDFESKKIACQPDFDRHLRQPSFRARSDRVVFKVKDVEVTYGDLLDVFDEHFKRQILDLLAIVVENSRRWAGRDIWSHPESLQIVFAGGFSEFLPVRNLIAAYFQSRCNSTEVMNDLLSEAERWQCIALGAALVAGGAYSVIQEFPFTFGYYCFRDGERLSMPLVRQGVSLDTSISDIDPQGSQWLGVSNMTKAGQNVITLFVEQSGQITVDLPMRTGLDRLLPMFEQSDAWRLGYRIRNGVLSIVVTPRLRDSGRTGAPLVLQMGNIFELGDGAFRETPQAPRA